MDHEGASAGARKLEVQKQGVEGSFQTVKVDFDDGMDARWIVGVAARPDDGVAIDPDDRAAEIPVVVVTLDVICSVLLYNL